MIWIKTARYILVVFVILVMAIYLPSYYWLAFKTKISRPVVFYSPVLKKFTFIRSENKQTVFTDEDRKIYTREEFEELNPLQNFRQLSLSGNLPDSLEGVKLELSNLNLNSIFTRFSPDNLDKPQISIFPLIESQSGRVRLELPNEYFRFNTKFEVIDSRKNEVDTALSNLFMIELIKANFSFPAKAVFGNPTTMKPFDEGYFIVDSENKVFHLKRVKEKPFVVNINTPKTLDVYSIIVQEMSLKESYGYIITRDNKIFLISYDNYRLIQLPIEVYDYRNTTFWLRGDILYRTISLVKENEINVFVTDRDYKLIDRYNESWKGKYEYSAGVVSKILFPFTISLTDANTTYVNFYFNFSGILSLFGIGISLILALVYLKRKKIKIKYAWFECLIVLLTGLYGLIAVVFISNVK